MAPTPLSDPLKHSSLVHGDAGLVVTVRASGRLALRRAFAALRRATGDVLWSVDLGGGQDAQFVIPRDELLRGFEEVWPDQLRPPPAWTTARPHSSPLTGAPHPHRRPGASRSRPTASWGRSARAPTTTPPWCPSRTHGRLAGDAVRERAAHRLPPPGGGISFTFGPEQPPVRSRGSVLWVRRRETSWELHGELETASFAVTGGSMVLVPRRSGEPFTLATTIESVDAPESLVGERRLRFTATLEQHQLLGRFDRPELMDAHRGGDQYDDPPELRVRRLAPGPPRDPDLGLLGLRPRRGVPGVPDVQGLLARVRVQAFDTDAVTSARTPWRSGKVLRWRTRGRPVWVVGERPETARTLGSRSTSTSGTPTPRSTPATSSPATPPTAIASPGTPVPCSSAAASTWSRCCRPGGSPPRTTASTCCPSGDRSSNATSRGPGLPPARCHGHQEHGRQLRLLRPGFTADVFVVSSEREREMIEQDFAGRLDGSSSRACPATTGSSPPTARRSAASSSCRPGGTG